MGHPFELIHCETALNSILLRTLFLSFNESLYFSLARPPRKFPCVLSVSIIRITVAATSSKNASLHSTLHGWSASLTLRCGLATVHLPSRGDGPQRFSNAMNLLICL